MNSENITKTCGGTDGGSDAGSVGVEEIELPALWVGVRLDKDVAASLGKVCGPGKQRRKQAVVNEALRRFLRGLLRGGR